MLFIFLNFRGIIIRNTEECHEVGNTPLAIIPTKARRVVVSILVSIGPEYCL